MKQQSIIFFTFLLLCTFSCDIDQTKKAKMPEVDVDVKTKAGQLPSFEVDWASVDVGTKTTTVSVPKVVVVMEEEEVEVPYIDVDMPNDKLREEQTITVEAELSGKSQKIDIKEIYATGKRLYVISELTPTGQDLGKEKMRVSDRIVLYAPDLDIKHYIIGNKPKGAFNNQYAYINSRNEIASKLAKGKQIYSK